MLLTIVGCILLLLGVLVFFRKNEGEIELSALGMRIKSNNSAVLIVCLGCIFILIGQVYSKSGSNVSLFNPTPGSNPPADSTLTESGTITTRQSAPAGPSTISDPTVTNSNEDIAGIYPESSERSLTYADIQNKSPYQLKIMRNEIFARHGYIFKTADMKAYFGSQSWYKPRYDDVSDKLTAIENQNVEFIRKYE